MKEYIVALAALTLIAATGYKLRPQPEQADKPDEHPRPAAPVEVLYPQEPVAVYLAAPVFVPYDVPLSAELQQYTAAQCAAAEPPVPFEIALALMEHESGFQADALGYNRNGSEDHGLMQVNTCNHEWMADKLGLEDFLDPEQNIRAGVYLLSLHLENHPEDLHRALMAYQYGESGAQKKWQEGILQSDFSRAVITRAEELKGGPTYV